MTAAVAAPSTSTARSPVRTRLLAVLASLVGTLLVWVVATQALGIDLLIAFGDGAAQSVQVPFVAAGSLVPPLLGWGVLALLERRSARGARAFAVLATAVLVVSFVFPAIAATTVATGVTLAVMHLVVFAAVVPAFVASSPRR